MCSLPRRTWLGSVAGALLALALGCSRGRGAPPGELPRNPRRIVSLSPSTTETLFALGVGGRLVGRSRYCDYPPEVAALPVVGGFVDASFEAILGLLPDLVVGAQGPAGRALVDRLEALGIATFFPRTESMSEIDSMMSDLAAKLGVLEQGRALVDRVRARRESVARALRGEPRPRTLLVFGLSPIVVAGPGGFPDEMLGLAAAENVIAAGGPYPTVNIEHLLGLDPDLIVDARSARSHEGSGRIDRGEPGWRELRAVRAGRVVALREDAALRPGPRIGEGLAALARAIHPGSRVP